MRIGLACTELAPATGAGGGMGTLQMALALADAGHDVHVVTLAPDAPLTPSAPPPSPIARSASTAFKVHYADPHAPPANLLHDCSPAIRQAFALYQALRDLHRTTPLDVIELADFNGQAYFPLVARETLGEFGGTLMAVRLHTPNIVGRAENQIDWVNRADALIEYMETTALRLADLLSAPTQAVLDKISRRLPGVPRDRSTAAVIANPWRISAEPLCRNPDPDNPLVLCFGRFEWRKGQDLLVDAAVRLLEQGTRFRLMLVGSGTWTGPLGTRMDEYVLSRIPASWHDQIVVHEWMTREQLADLIDRATVVVSPSRWDNYPYALVETMARGCPVLVGTGGGPSELIVHNESGFLFRSGDVEELARVLAEVLAQPSATEQVGSRGRERVQALCDPVRIAAEVGRAVHTARQGINVVGTSAESDFRNAQYGVVVRCAGGVEGFGESLASVMGLSPAPAEVVVAGTPEMTHGLHPPTGVRVMEVAGGSAAGERNAALALINSPFVLFLDAGDTIDPTFAGKALDVLFRRRGMSWVASLVEVLSSSGDEVIGGWVRMPMDRDMLCAMNPCFGVSGVMFDRKELGEGFDAALPGYPEWDLYCRLAARGGQSAVLPEFLTRHRLQAGERPDGTATDHHYRLTAMMMARHPGLAVRPWWVSQLVLAETLDRVGARRRRRGKEA
ncbi:MAG: glycosyltransferase [Phycisphaeraceae bacterium]|nr:glycosyltransferase [Phycisphaeraceae bacterium]